MADQPKQTLNIYALLIGIDYYKPNRFYPNLKGCVRDINLVDDYLRRTLQIPAERVRKLTSPDREDSTLSQVRGGNEPDVLPTYENIVNAFKEITEKAQPQEIVYIHYSGHGGRATTIYKELKEDGQHDEGIVPMDIGEQDGRYLRDIELATLLKRMTDKGLIVTVVLDSCHSGGATRGDCAIRGSQEEDTATRPQDSLVASRQELFDNWRSLVEGSNRTAWVPDSENYVVLTACRPTESAWEYAENGKERHGALTYWMIDTLNAAIFGTLTYKTLHDRVSAKIQSKFRDQLPMLLGKGDLSVFGSNLIANPYTMVVIEVDASQKQVKLNAQLANSLCIGARFAMYPLNTSASDLTDKQKRLAIVEVTDIEASSVRAKVLEEADGGIGVKGQIEQGAPVVILSAPPFLIRRVRLFDRKKLGDAEEELLTQDLVERQKDALDRVRQALAENGWVVEVQGEEEAHYQVAIGRQGEYEICRGMPIKNLNPALSIGGPEAPKEVVKRLVHLAKYQAIQELDNPESKLNDYLEFVLLDEKKQPLPDQSNIVLKQGTLAYLRVKNNFKNNSRQALNVGVLDLEPTWAISQIPLQGIDGPFYELAPEETLDTRLRFKLPESKEDEQASEILKLFATRGPANFRWLRLPSLDKKIERHHEATRGSQSAFGKLLEAIGEDPNISPSLNRAAVYEPDPKAEWVTKQIQITIEP
ncbi:caspase family protein [Microcoleus sp. ARI1-B5]|uniref:caspase family protein n=1 Tax=unclassified Microcoleus TaxID=2642155 RepID=UPI002FD44EA3